MTSGQIPASARIEQFAVSLSSGDVVTASEVVVRLQSRSVTERSVGLIFRSIPDVMEYMPVKKGGRGLWRRR